MKIKTINVDIDILSSGVSLWQCSRDEISSQFPSVSFERCRGKSIFVDDANPVIWLADDMEYNKIPTLAHEVIHAIYEILDQKGIQMDEELLAYLVEYVLNSFMRKLKLECVESK